LLDERCVLPSRNLYRVIDAIGTRREALSLRGRKERWWGCFYEQSALRIVGTSAHPDPSVSFASEPLPLPPRYGCSLTVAKWPNGSRAFLDSRGLLHLKSHDASVPEISLVLSGEVAAWTSDGHTCGPKFFFEGPHVSEPEKVFDRIQEFIRRL